MLPTLFPPGAIAPAVYTPGIMPMEVGIPSKRWPELAGAPPRRSGPAVHDAPPTAAPAAAPTRAAIRKGAVVPVPHGQGDNGVVIQGICRDRSQEEGQAHAGPAATTGVRQRVIAQQAVLGDDSQDNVGDW
jgi:hypothetical protein